MSVIASSDCSSSIAPPEILSEGNGELERSTSGSCTKLKSPHMIIRPSTALVIIEPRDVMKVACVVLGA